MPVISKSINYTTSVQKDNYQVEREIKMSSLEKFYLYCLVNT